MIHQHQGFFLGIAILIGLVLSGQATAVAPEIKDDGKFFGADAIKKANKQIREIARKYEKDLLIDYVLICKDPSHLEIVITKKARPIFDKAAFEKLRELLLKNFREKHYDEGLDAVVNFVQEKLAAAASK